MKRKRHDRMKQRKDLTGLVGLQKKVIPADHSQQVVSTYYLDYLFAQDDTINIALDLGCGTGWSLSMFRNKNPGIRWIGLDTESYSEDWSMTEGGEFYTYDGVHFPFDDNYFDLIYCNQVLEHVKYPRKLLKEVNRVLKLGGYFIGSTSHLEPYHGYSIWNYTPYGFFLLVEEAELELIEIRPSIDALSLIIRHGLLAPKFASKFWSRSPLNIIIDIVGKIRGWETTEINCIKLNFCGQFSFLVVKPDRR